MNLLPTSNTEWEVPKSENKRKKKDSLFFYKPVTDHG